MVIKKGQAKIQVQKDVQDEGMSIKTEHGVTPEQAQKQRRTRRQIFSTPVPSVEGEHVRPLSRKYFAVDQARIAFWFPFIKREKVLTEKGTFTTQDSESGFDCIIEDLAQCTVEEIAQCAPPGYITLRNRTSIEDISHLFYAIDLDNLTDRAYNPIPEGKIPTLIAYFMHIVARPKIDPKSRAVMVANPKGAELAGLPPLIQSVDPYVCYLECADDTLGSYNPDDYLLPESYQDLVPQLHFRTQRTRSI